MSQTAREKTESLWKISGVSASFQHASQIERQTEDQHEGQKNVVQKKHSLE
jgi:hypothetical protein